MKRYTVQYETPCEYPENNVRMICRKNVNHFYVPLNHQSAHNMGLQDLIEAVERGKLFALSTGLNNTGKDPSERVTIRHGVFERPMDAGTEQREAASEAEAPELPESASQEHRGRRFFIDRGAFVEPRVDE